MFFKKKEIEKVEAEFKVDDKVYCQNLEGVVKSVKEVTDYSYKTFLVTYRYIVEVENYIFKDVYSKNEERTTKTVYDRYGRSHQFNSGLLRKEKTNKKHKYFVEVNDSSLFERI